MKKILMILGFLSQFFPGKSQSKSFDRYPVYTGNDLGLTYSPKQSAFRIWAPTAEQAELLFYKAGTGGDALRHIKMQKAGGGTWRVVVPGDQKGVFYVFRVRINGKWLDEVPDPYAKSVGVNGKRAMVVDLTKTNPPGWEQDESPVFHNATDAVIYELHVRDASIAANSGIQQKGKFAGLTETGTHNNEGLSTGLDHLKELGVTHIHLLPCFDFNSVDESKPGQPQYNWGYDPLNYNVPEGSYSTNPYDGVTRIKEFKSLVQAFHQNGLRVVMDVVYNHTALTGDAYFNQLVPGYYYRQDKKGGFSNATACGNEIASERAMVRKFILESVKYWVNEYHVDGFRFDLMGVHDIATMNIISAELHKIRPGILLYGEGWTAGSSPLADSLRALKKYAYKLDRIAVFSDDIRDGIKGSVFDHQDGGFASGKPGMEESIKFGVVAACRHPQVQYKKVNYSRSPYAKQPYQVISYCSCHDNHTLWDKLALSASNATEEERVNMQKLALSIVLTSQGIAFLHAGSEFLRSKQGVENSFNAPDSINAIDWHLKTVHQDVFDYVKSLISMRKSHPAFRLRSGRQVANDIRFWENLPPGLVAYTIKGAAVKDQWKNVAVLLNGTATAQSVDVHRTGWKIYSRDNNIAGGQEMTGHNVTLAPYSCTILYKE
jgi:pullulanase